MSSKMGFRLTFDGEALDNNEIEPSILANALLAIETIFKEANSVLNAGHSVDIKTKIKGSFESGSFAINLVVDTHWIRDLLNGEYTTAICNAFTITSIIFTVGASGYASVITVLKFLKGQRPDSIVENEDKTFTIEKDKKYLVAEQETLELIKNQKFRKSFEKLISPLNADGVDELYMIIEKEPILICNKSEREYFKCPEMQEKLLDTPIKYETNIKIINLSFKEGNKWYVSDGDDTGFYTIVEDKEFLAKIDSNHIAFAKGDILKVLLRQEQSITEEQKIKKMCYIEKVIEHKSINQIVMSLF